jgi:hypothetical protein
MNQGIEARRWMKDPTRIYGGIIPPDSSDADMTSRRQVGLRGTW